MCFTLQQYVLQLLLLQIPDNVLLNFYDFVKRITTATISDGVTRNALK